MDNSYSFSDEEEQSQSNSNHLTPVSHHIARPIRHGFTSSSHSYSGGYYPPEYPHEFPSDPSRFLQRDPPQNSIAKIIESNSKLISMVNKMSERITKIEESLKSDGVSSSSSSDAASISKKKRLSTKLSVS